MPGRDPARERHDQLAWRPTVLVATLGVLPVTLDSAVNIAFPAISTAFDTTVAGIQWVIIAFVLTFAALVWPAGRVADRLGHRPVFVVGLGVTLVALSLCGAAWVFGALLSSRVLQGVGAALSFGSAPALVTLATPEDRRGQALGWFNLSVTGGRVLGPLLGGALVRRFQWRAVFWGRVPIALAALLLARLALPPAVAPSPEPEEGPELAVRLIRRRAFVLANGANLLGNTALFFVWLLVPFYLVDQRGMSTAEGGLLLAAGALAMAVASPVGGLYADRRGTGWLAPCGLLMEAGGLALVSRLDATSSPVEIGFAVALGGGGLGLFSVPNMHYVMGALPRARQGWAGSLVALMRMAGVVVGARVGTWLYRSRRTALIASGSVPSLAAAGAFAHAFRVAAWIAVLAALLSWAGGGAKMGAEPKRLPSEPPP